MTADLTRMQIVGLVVFLISLAMCGYLEVRMLRGILRASGATLREQAVAHCRSAEHRRIRLLFFLTVGTGLAGGWLLTWTGR